MINEISEWIFCSGSPWSRFLLLQQVKGVPPDDSILLKTRDTVLQDARIQTLITRLSDPHLGIPSIKKRPAGIRVYGAYALVLRFFADIGLTAEELSIDALIRQLFLYQLPDGQFTLDYRRPKKSPVSAICHTAHLTSSLARLGYMHSSNVRMGLNFILTTQRLDGGWHCDLHKQTGEREQSAPSCPSANIHVLRALSACGFRDEQRLENAAGQIYAFFQHPRADGFSCDLGIHCTFRNLRYPSHYGGFDPLHLLDTLSYFPRLCRHEVYDEMKRDALEKWDGKGLFRSGKTIPEWKEFDFGRKGSRSDWISALICRVLARTCRP